MKQQLSLHEPTFDELDEQYVLEALRSTWVSTGGPFVNQFETEFAEFVGSKHAISVANGTVGIQLAIECLKRQKNISETFDVLTPSLTFIATSNAIIHAGGLPQFLDVSENSFQIDYESVKKSLNHYSYSKSENLWRNKETRRPLLALLPAHIMGWSVSMDKLYTLAQEYQISILEDAAEALGSFDSTGKHLGINSLASIFSFNGNKILTTGGGGMIVTNDDQFASYLKHLSTTAKIDNLRFIHDEVGYNYRLVNILAALGCSQLKKLSERLKKKQLIFEHYKNAFINSNIKVYEQDPVSKVNHWLVNLIFNDLNAREQVLKNLIANGIQARPLWTPCHLQPAYAEISQHNTKFENTEKMWKTSLSVPSSPHLTEDQLDFIAKICIDSLEK